MAIIGRAALIIALVVCAYGIFASVYGALKGRRDFVESARRAVYALALTTTVAFAVLEIAFLRSDFSFSVVASHSSTTTPWHYKAAAMWSSQEGSLLLWVWLLSIWSSLVIFLTRHRLRDVVPWATAVLLGYGAFFTGLLVFWVHPFTTLAQAPADGQGLNPLLRHPAMMIHPPMLYSGYTLFAIPFAFAIGALIAKRVDAEWIRSTRRFALAAWLLLGCGILLGARWSYTELGWGGYWAWDAVENASLMPWLTGTAFIHSIMIQEKRGMLKVWNVSLVLATGILCVLGTFLVRSGILDSIHAFGASTLGVPFVTLIAGMSIGSIALVVWRRGLLRSEHKLDSFLSREAIFLLNNLVLVALCFVIFWLTFLPLITEIFGDQRAVGPPVFSRYTVPLALVLVLLSGIGPLIAWRRATPRNLRKTFAMPVLFGVVAFVALLFVPNVPQKPLALAMFVLGAFVIGTIAQEVWRGAVARHAMTGEVYPLAVVSLVRRNRRRYGGYFVHLGIVILFVGVAASTAFQHAEDVRLQVGQTATVNGYQVKYERSTATYRSDPRGTGALLTLGAVLDVSKHGKHVATLYPARGYFPSDDASQGLFTQLINGDPTSEVALKTGPTRDFWTAVSPDFSKLQPMVDAIDKAIPPNVSQAGLIRGLQAGLTALQARYEQSPPPAMFRLISSPLVMWIWIGALISIGGGLIALWPAPDAARRRATAAIRARVAQDLGRA